MSDSIVIIHFQPLEKYPPAVNLLRCLAEKNQSKKIIAITTGTDQLSYTIEIKGVEIIRVEHWKKNMGKLDRMQLYVGFGRKTLGFLSAKKPGVVFYYETVSALGPWLYFCILKNQARLFIHYHEYTSPKEYQQGMVLTRWLHRMEKQLYKKAEWISHTNSERTNLFIQDIGANDKLPLRILPNHPPIKWQMHSKGDSRIDQPLKMVYVGALGLENLYVREIAEWVKSKGGTCYLDIYSDNTEEGVEDFIRETGAKNISLKGGCKYEDLPSILSNYDVGLILYKGHIANYIYNVPNKLFEYHVCGLDVWFPQQMKSCHPLVTTNSYPKILSVDFEHLSALQVDEMTQRENLYYYKKDFSAENTYAEIVQSLLN